MRELRGSSTWAAASAVVVTAVAAGLPSLRLPLISDDWSNLAAVSDGVPWRTPFGYVRPLYLALFRLGRLLWGLSAWPYHAMSLVLFAACALLVFTLVRRLTGDRILSTAAAVVFALQPFSIEVTAWPSAQADLLACMFALASLIAWDIWRTSRRAGALAAVFAFFVLGLLSKESAIVVPPLIALVEWRLARTTPRARGAVAAIAVLAAVAAVHILFLRPHLLGKDGIALPQWSAGNARGAAIGYVAATVLPLPAEILEFHNRLAALAAAAVLITLAVLARRAAGRVPAAAWFGGAAAVVAGVPALFAFQERYYLMASVGVSVALVALVRADGRKMRFAIVAAAGIVWGASTALQWAEWYSAGRVSVAVVAGLAREAADPNVREIVIANLPHRVRGAPVVTDMSAIIKVISDRKIPVAMAARVDFGSENEDGLDGTDGPAVVRDGADFLVHLRVPSGVYRRLVRPIVPVGGTVPTQGDSLMSWAGAERYTLRIPERRAAGRSVVVWTIGALVPASALAP